jgi:hypothetical protein
MLMLFDIGVRRNKVLRSIGEYRIRDTMSEAADRIIKKKRVPRPEGVTSKRSSAA